MAECFYKKESEYLDENTSTEEDVWRDEEFEDEYEDEEFEDVWRDEEFEDEYEAFEEYEDVE